MDLIHQNGERLFVTSLDISNRFGKLHKDVLRAIENLDCSQEFRRRNFTPSSYSNRQNKPQPMFEITRDGFAFLCMGFTGLQAALWKERYIEAFNRMEAALRHSPVPAPTARTVRVTRSVERQVMERFVAGHGNRQIAQALGISPATACLILLGKYQFSPAAGEPECSPALIAAVAARHLALEQERLAGEQQRIANRYRSTAGNRQLRDALDHVGRQLQQPPARAMLASPVGEA